MAAPPSAPGMCRVKRPERLKGESVLRRFTRRRKFIVDRALQLRLIAISLGYVVFFVLAVTAALFVPLMLQLRTADLNTSDAFDFATSALYLHKHFWPVALLSLAVVALHAVLTSHRLAGPLYRFRRIIESVRDGCLPGPGRLRRRDYLQPEMKLINEMLEGLRARVAEIQAARTSLAESISECRRRAETLGDDELTRCIGDLAVKGDRLAESVDSFRTQESDNGGAAARDEVSLRDKKSGCRRSPLLRNSQGFTLVELLIAAAIIATVAAIAIPAYTEMINSANVARAVGDVQSMSAQINLYEYQRGALPDTLADMGLDQRHDPWGRPYAYLPIRGKSPRFGDLRKDRSLVPLNSDYDLYSVGKDGLSEPPLTARHSYDDIVRANNGGYVGLGKNY